MSTIFKKSSQKASGIPQIVKTKVGDDLLYQHAFNFSFQANIVTDIRSGNIIMANHAACRLLGYSHKELLAKTRDSIFDANEPSFKIMLKQRMVENHSVAFVTAVKKGGKRLPCEITSAVLPDHNRIKKAITTISDISKNLFNQEKIDSRKEKIVAENIFFAESRQKDIDIEKEKIVKDNIVLARSRQKNIDVKKARIVAENIVVAKFQYDALLETRLGQENRLKKIQIAEASEDARDVERSDIGKELHDNINQLLGTSNMYIGLAKGGGENRNMYLSRSSEYTIMAIEEIRKLTRKLTSDSLSNISVCEAIENLAVNIMITSPIKVFCSLDSFSNQAIEEKFNLNIFRIVQEHLNNIIKHAKAKKVTIRLSQNKKSIVLSISDNGIGFDTHQEMKGIGISNIKSRAKTFDGLANFVSAPGKGCLLTVKFPVQKSTTS